MEDWFDRIMLAMFTGAVVIVASGAVLAWWAVIRIIALGHV